MVEKVPLVSKAPIRVEKVPSETEAPIIAEKLPTEALSGNPQGGNPFVTPTWCSHCSIIQWNEDHW